MPAKSKAQGNLMRAAEHGAGFPMAKKVRKSMTKDQMHDFAKTKTKEMPKHVGGKKKGGREHPTDPKKLEPMKKKAKEQMGRKHATDPKPM